MQLCDNDTCSKPIKTDNNTSQGGCARCIRAGQPYENTKCTECILTATAEHKFPNFHRAPDACFPHQK